MLRLLGIALMSSLPRALMFITFAMTVVYGQSLHVPPSTANRKSPGVFSMILDSPAGKAPVAMQWELSVPPALAVEKGDISPGKAAETAKKSLTCAPTNSQIPGGTRYICILAGGQEPIGSGPIAMIRYRAQADVHGAPIRVAIQKILGVSADLKRIEMPNTDAIIKIQ